ncbi:MAG: Lrp/AsnC family transcriptional regulator [Thermoplasmata archaeon]|nr:Lrp/AsnC family transcriptional regulator [Thermoplasmata archaeon]
MVGAWIRMNDMTILEQQILNELQKGIEPVPRPFQRIANKLSCTEEDVLAAINDLKEKGLIRKFGAIIAPKKMGYVSTLAAMNVPDDEVDRVSQMINSYHGVTHNYLRDGEPNLWFTMIEKDDEILERNLSQIIERTGLKIIKLPATRTYKIGVRFDI